MLTDKRKQELCVKKHASVSKVLEVSVVDCNADEHASISNGEDNANELLGEAWANPRRVCIPDSNTGFAMLSNRSYHNRSELKRLLIPTKKLMFRVSEVWFFRTCLQHKPQL